MKPITRNLILLLAALILILIVVGMQLIRDNNNALTVYYLNAGKADAILLTTKNSAVLIDTGSKGFGDEIVQKLKEQGLSGIDCMILTHFDKDHIGAATELIKSVKVGSIIQSPLEGNSEEYAKYMKAADKRGIERNKPEAEYSFMTDGVKYSVYPPMNNEYSLDESNNSSLIIRVEYCGGSFLFTGDAENARLQEFINGGAGRCDVLKIPHHGSWQPLLRPLAEMTGTKAAVICCSEKEPEDSKTAELLEDLGISVYATRKGTVRAVCDKDGIVIDYFD